MEFLPWSYDYLGAKDPNCIWKSPNNIRHYLVSRLIITYCLVLDSLDSTLMTLSHSEATEEDLLDSHRDRLVFS